MIDRKDCTCSCHGDSNITHIVACCTGDIFPQELSDDALKYNHSPSFGEIIENITVGHSEILPINEPMLRRATARKPKFNKEHE